MLKIRKFSVDEVGGKEYNLLARQIAQLSMIMATKETMGILIDQQLTPKGVSLYCDRMWKLLNELSFFSALMNAMQVAMLTDPKGASAGDPAKMLATMKETSESINKVRAMITNFIIAYAHMTGWTPADIGDPDIAEMAEKFPTMNEEERAAVVKKFVDKVRLEQNKTTDTSSSEPS